MEFINDYGLFLAKTVTLLVALAAVVGLVAGIGQRGRRDSRGHLEIRKLNDDVDAMADTLRAGVYAASTYKMLAKARQKAEKIRHKQIRQEQKKEAGDVGRKRVYVINFHGDLRASAVRNLRAEITAILSIARADDEAVVKLESAGGMVHSYGLAASQLDRIKKKGVPLTISVDKVAASGGYMMACVGDRILAAPFAVLGSIGVVAQIPNIHRLLKKHDIDVELMTAGKYKRTLTVLGENTDAGREKFREDLEQTHDLFKTFIGEHRAGVEVDKVATGEVWLGTRARELGLVDELLTSDEYLTGLLPDADVFEVTYIYKKTLPEKIGLAAEEGSDRLLMRWVEYFRGRGFYS